MDLQKLDLIAAADQGAEMVLKHPTSGDDLLDDDGNPVTITLLGSDSKEARRLRHQRANANMKGRKKPVAAEEVEDADRELVVSLTIDWSGIKVEGEAWEFSKEKARELYTRFPWVQEQADVFAGDRSNFLSSKSA